MTSFDYSYQNASRIKLQGFLARERLRPTRFMALFEAAYSTGGPDSKNIDSFSIRTYKNVINSAFLKKVSK